MLELDLAKKLNEITKQNYPLKAPQGVIPPYLTYAKVSNSRKYILSGYSGDSEARMQINCIGKTYSEAKLLAQQLIKTLETWPNANSIQSVFNENEIDMYDEDTGFYQIPVDFIINYKEAN